MVTRTVGSRAFDLVPRTYADIGDKHRRQVQRQMGLN